jgi:hypothetical protein
MHVQACYSPGMLTRSQVAKRLGRSIATVRKMEGRALHPVQNERGVWLFDDDEVDDIAQAVAASGRALSCDDDAEPTPWDGDQDSQSDRTSRADVFEFEQAQRRIREHRAEIAALQARVDSLEEDAALDLDEPFDDDDEPSSNVQVFLLLLFGAVGVGLVTLLKRVRRPDDDLPAREA